MTHEQPGFFEAIDAVLARCGGYIDDDIAYGAVAAAYPIIAAALAAPVPPQPEPDESNSSPTEMVSWHCFDGEPCDHTNTPDE